MKSGYFSYIKNLFLCAALMFFVAGCGTNNTTADSNTGAIVAKLAWNSNSNTPSQGKIVAKAADGVATVRVIVTGSGMTDMQRDFVAADGGGVIDGIQSGSGRTLKAQGLDSNSLVTYQGEISNITIQAGQVTDIGTITMLPVATGKIGGTIAVGKPLANTLVTLTDATGKTVSTTTDLNGQYSINNPGLVAPILIAATPPGGGDYSKIISVVSSLQSSTSATNDVVNVTPATTMIAASALGKSPDLINITDAKTIGTTALNSSSDKLKNLLTGISNLLGLSTTFDFSSTVFDANGTGIDKIFDLLKFSTNANDITVQSREGFRSTASSTDPAGVQVSPFDWLSTKGESITKLAVSNYHKCVLVQSGKVYCWGQNMSGSLGNGTNTDSLNVPVVVGTFTDAVDVVAADSGWSCVLLADGKVYCWGSGAHGEMGQWPSTANSNVPVLMGFSSLAKSISISDGPSCVVLDTGGLECWGENGGIWSVPQTTLGSNAVQVSSGATHACVKLFDGTVRCLGWNNGSGELGNTVTTTLPSSRKIATVPLTKSVANVSAGGYYSCALFVDGTVQCWGQNGFGQLGNGLFSNSTTPVNVAFNASVVALQASWTHTCAILTGGVTQCWGKNDYGQLGATTTQTVTTDGNGFLLPFPVAISNTPLTATSYQGAATRVISTYFSSCVLNDAGHFQCWGTP